MTLLLPNNVLIIGPAWVGDMVMSHSLIQLLNQRSPNTLIDVVAPEWGQALLSRMPEVRQTISLPIKHGEFGLKKRIQIAEQLNKNNYQQAIVLPNSWKSALIPFLAKIPLRTGWCGEMRWGLLNDLRYLNKQQYPLMVERFLMLGLPKNSELPQKYLFPKLTVLPETQAASLAQFNLSLQQPILALCPGAEYGPAKRWPANYFAEVAQYYLKQGWQVWLFGANKETDIANTIQQICHHQCVDLVGKTNLAQAIDLLSLSSAVVSNDSGLMHIAAALQRPLVVVYGSTDPEFTPPLTSQVKSLRLNLPCSPCFERVCPLKHMNCLNQILPQQVCEAVTEIIKSNNNNLNVAHAEKSEGILI